MNSFIIAFVIVNVYLVVRADQYDSCPITNNEHGECIPIRNCSHLYALIRKRPLSQSDTALLRRLHCGFDGSIPKVCCSNKTTSNHDDGLTTRISDEEIPPTKLKVLPDPVDCGIDSGKKIVGGEKTELDEFPWMALLRFVTPKQLTGFSCGGVLISKRYVLTAAHCIKGNGIPRDWSVVSVRLGEYNKDSDDDCILDGFKKNCLKIPPFDVQIEEIITHENYNPDDDNQRNDIALLRLKKDIKYTDYVRPICLPLRKEERAKTYAGATLTVAGWGQTEKRSSSNIKLKVNVPVKTNSHCNSIYVDADRQLDDNQMCAGGQEGKDSCKGDSGGPLMNIGVDENGDTSWYITGVVSFGPDPCGTEGWPSVYTRVSKYIGWILKNMKE